MTSKNRGCRSEIVTLGDRLVCASFGGVAGLSFWAIAYAVLFLGAVIVQSKPEVAARIAAGQAPATPWDVLPEFWYWGAVCGLVLALVGFLSGPERMMDRVERLFRFQHDWADDFVTRIEFSQCD